MFAWSSFAHRPDVSRTGIRCVGVGRSSVAATGVTGRVLRSHGLVIVTSGAGTFHSAAVGRKRVVGPAAFWLFPGTPHSYGPDPEGWDESWMLWTGSDPSELSELGVEPLSAFVELSGDRLNAIEATRAIDAIREDLNLPSPASRMRSTARAQLAIAAVAVANINAGSDQDEFMQRLSASITRDMPIAAHAAELSMTLPELRARIREITQMTPREFVTSMRITKAQSLLVESNISVAEIGGLVGFPDPAYFSRVFTRRVGVSPRAFRSELHRGAAETRPKR